MRRADREVTDRKQLEEILQACHAEHIGAQDGDGMFVVPMNYGFHLEGDRLTLYVHSAQEGRKASALRAGWTVAFERGGPPDRPSPAASLTPGPRSSQIRHFCSQSLRASSKLSVSGLVPRQSPFLWDLPFGKSHSVVSETAPSIGLSGL